MPLYDFKCVECEKEKLDFQKRMADANPECCSKPMRQLYNTKIETWDSSLVFEHIADKPMRFSNKRDLREYCNRNGKISHLLDA